MSDLASLNVFIRGSRDYVQGTQIVSRTAELLPDGDWKMTLCQFKKITKQIVGASLVENKSAPSIGRAVFENSLGQRLNYYFYNQEPSAASMNTDMDIDWHLKRSTEPLCGTIYFQRLSSFESGLNVMVQGVKELHSMLNNSVHDVWWTGLRGGALNVKWKESLTAGQINVNPIRILANNGSYQSLVQLNWAFEGVEDKLKCFVSFVVKSQEEIYVS